ncbi:MAG: hypothetical protein ABIU96_03995 [Rhodanobacter sp.]
MIKVSTIVPIIAEWQRRIIAVDQQLDALFAVVGFVESPLTDTIFSLATSYTEATAARVGDHDEWLDWYWRENGMGSKRGQCKAARWKKERPIGTVHQLAQLIVASP